MSSKEANTRASPVKVTTLMTALSGDSTHGPRGGKVADRRDEQIADARWKAPEVIDALALIVQRETPSERNGLAAELREQAGRLRDGLRDEGDRAQNPDHVREWANTLCLALGLAPWESAD